MDELTRFEKEAIEQIRNAINVIQVNEDAVGMELAEIHPTLQQGFMRIVLGFLRQMAAKKYTDDRNRRAAELAKELLAGVDVEEVYLPLI